MVKVLKTYESKENEWLETITHYKVGEVLTFKVDYVDSNNEVKNDLYELATSNEDIIKIRDFLNSLDLGDS